MKKTLAGSCLALLLLSGAAAAEGMAGISMGQSAYDDTALSAYSSNGSRTDNQSLGFKIYGGVAFGPHLSAHAGLYSLGDTSSETLTTRTEINNGIPVAVPDARDSYQLDNTGFFLEGRWQWRAGAAWRPYVKAGMAINNSKLKFTSIPVDTAQPSSSNEESRSSVALAPGIGLVYESLRHWGLQLEWERYLGVKAPADIPDQDIDNISLGIYGYW